MAEIAGMMHLTSLRAPLSNSAMAVYWRAFVKSVGPVGEGPVGLELHPGQVDEDIAAMRRKLRAEDRGKE